MLGRTAAIASPVVMAQHTPDPCITMAIRSGFAIFRTLHGHNRVVSSQYRVGPESGRGSAAVFIKGSGQVLKWGLRRRVEGGRSFRETAAWRKTAVWSVGRDFLIGFSVFCGLAGLFILDGEGSMHAEVFRIAPNPAGPTRTAGVGGPIKISQSVDQVIAERQVAALPGARSRPLTATTSSTGPHKSRPYVALIIIATVFSALVAFNLAFFRHLRRRYSWRQTGFH